ncbi:methylase [Streptococcus panodentis]|uniref:Methylase n=1 Tax=Streptococcus panodentis TaxID=1581472 RepID=A0ABS5AZJ1_9STRE|nr:methylase [Streptococcus panodentis]
MTEKIIKSKHRVQKHGEVFTPSWMVQKMLDIPGVKEATEDVYATFLEPSAGDGNFLEAILERKLFAVTQKYDKRNWKTKSLFAVSSIYGIEFLEDNLEVARSRMFLHYLDWIERCFGERLTSRSDLYKSAHYLINRNIVRGNTLTKRHPVTDELIMFSEWKRVKGHPSLVERVRFAFAELFGEVIIDDEDKVVKRQLSLFELSEENAAENETNNVRIQKVYTLGD